jgi:hypothetical protein
VRSSDVRSAEFGTRFGTRFQGRPPGPLASRRRDRRRQVKYRSAPSDRPTGRLGPARAQSSSHTISRMTLCSQTGGQPGAPYGSRAGRRYQRRTPRGAMRPTPTATKLAPPSARASSELSSVDSPRQESRCSILGLMGIGVAPSNGARALGRARRLSAAPPLTTAATYANICSCPIDHFLHAPAKPSSATRSTLLNS